MGCTYIGIQICYGIVVLPSFDVHLGNVRAFHQQQQSQLHDDHDWNDVLQLEVKTLSRDVSPAHGQNDADAVADVDAGAAADVVVVDDDAAAGDGYELQEAMAYYVRYEANVMYAVGLLDGHDDVEHGPVRLPLMSVVYG